MALFNLSGSSNTVKAEYKDLRTNVEKITFKKGEIEIEFNGFTQQQLDNIAIEKAEDETEKREKAAKAGKSWLGKKLVDVQDVKPEFKKSVFARQGDDILDLVFVQGSVQQIAEDAFKLKALTDNTSTIADALEYLKSRYEDISYDIYHETNKERKAELKEKRNQISAEIVKTKQQLKDKTEEMRKIRKEFAKSDGSDRDDLSEYIIYVTPMGLSYYESQRFTAIPPLAKAKSSSKIDFHKNKTSRVNSVSLARYLTEEEEIKAEDSEYRDENYYAHKLIYRLDNVEGPYAAEGYYKPDTLVKISDSEFTAVNYLTGCEEHLYVGFEGIEDNPELAFDKDPRNPNNPTWFNE